MGENINNVQNKEFVIFDRLTVSCDDIYEMIITI